MEREPAAVVADFLEKRREAAHREALALGASSSNMTSDSISEDENNYQYDMPQKFQ